MQREAQITAELLSTHAGGLRALAFELVGDAHAAEDVLQDVYLRSIGRVPASASPSGVRAWFREVVRGLALNHKRGAAHRAERETAHARSAAARAERGVDCDAREKGETLQCVVSAVLALDEPYKTTVLLRYFEGLTQSEIASRTNAPLATVASRLQRAHQKLRLELERGGTRLDGLLAPLLGAGWSTKPAIAASIGKGVLWMGLKTVAATALVLLVALGLWFLASSPEAPVAVESGAREGHAGDVVAAARLDSDTGRGEVAARESAVPSDALTAGEAEDSGLGAGPYMFELELVVVDAHGVPQSRVPISAAPEGQPLADFGTSGWNGRLVKRWLGFAPTLTLVVRADTSTLGETDLRHLKLAAGNLERATLALPSVAESPLGGGGYFRTRVVLDNNEIHLVGSALARRADAERPPNGFALDAHGNGVFEDPFLFGTALQEPALVLADVPLVGGFFQVNVSEYSGGSTAIFPPSIAPADAPIPETLSMRGILLDVQGAPAPKVLVTLQTAETELPWTTRTDEHGGFEFHGLRAAPALVSAGGPNAGFVAHEFVLEPAMRPLELRLQERGTLFARLVDEKSAPLSNWRVQAWSDTAERDFVRGGQCAEDGRVTLFDVGAGPLYLSARPSTDDVLMPARRVAERVFSQAEELVIVVRGGNELAHVEVKLASASGQLASEAVALLVCEDGVGSTWLHRVTAGEGADARAVWRCDRIVPGAYRIFAGAPCETWMELGRFELDPGAALDLGERRFAAQPLLAVELEQPEAKQGADGRCFVVRDGAVSRSMPFSYELPGEFAVPPGASRLVWTRRPIDEAPDMAQVEGVVTSDGAALTVAGDGTATAVPARGLERRAIDARPGATTKLVLPPVERAPR